MKRIAILTLSIAMFALAGLCNAFYTDLRVGFLNQETREFLFSWPASKHDQATFVDVFANKSVVPDRTERHLSKKYVAAQGAHFDKYCTLRGSRTRDGRLILSSVKSVCSKEFQWPGSKWETTTVKGTTYADGQELAERVLSRHPMVQGFTPSPNISYPQSISQSAITRAFWFGIVLPIALAACSLLLFLLAVLGLRGKGPNNSFKPTPLRGAA